MPASAVHGFLKDYQPLVVLAIPTPRVVWPIRQVMIVVPSRITHYTAKGVTTRSTQYLMIPVAYVVTILTAP